jgi:hypothetical protein
MGHLDDVRWAQVRATVGGTPRSMTQKAASVMAGLVPAIHVFLSIGRQDVDARDKPTSVWHGLCLSCCLLRGGMST